MSEQAELAFVKNYVNIISAQPVTFSDDHQLPPEESLKRVPVLQVRLSFASFSPNTHNFFQVDVPPPPERKSPGATASTGT